MISIIIDMLFHADAMDQYTAAPSGAQHGFVTRRSCLTKLLIAEEQVAKLMNAGEGVDLGYLDFTKAFYLVNH